MVEGIIPETYKEALEVLNSKKVTIMAGGTDLMVKGRNWSQLPPKFTDNILFISNLKCLSYIKKDETGLHIGSTTTLNELLNHKDIPKLLKKAVANMASPAIRHSGTIGGNVSNASPAGDTLPVLYVLNARVVLESINGERIINIKDFITGPGKTDRRSNELIKEFIIENENFDYESFEKVGGRKAETISKVAFCAGVKLKDNIIMDFRTAFGAVGPMVVRVNEIENKLVGKSVDSNKEDIIEILKEYSDYINPIDDQRSTAVYRKQCSLNLLNAFISKVIM